jgi:cell wall assembly regulator SMI1
MTERTSMRDVLDLLGRAPKPPEEPAPAGASQADLDELARRLGFGIPRALEDWLLVCNGSLAGPGGLYGANTANENVDIAFHLDLYPAWRRKRWIPVAGDGTGGRYVIDAGHAYADHDAVYFIDTAESIDQPAYIVASDLHHFLTFLLEKEPGTRGWPFDAEFVTARDPRILDVKDRALLPWSG